MKRFGILWDEFVSFGNLLKAYRKARRGKRNCRSVERFEYRREVELARLQGELINGCYNPGAYRTFMLNDTKPRMISAAPFRDRVVHHALCNVIEPIWERSFIYDSYASRRGKGTHAAIRRYQQFARKNAYVLKCDVQKFFPSIDHEILKTRLERKIKDRRVLKLAARIIDHSNPQTASPGFFAGDDLLTSLERRHGLPLGNQTSQFFGNVYLDSLDHFVKEQLRCECYLRYVDDFVLLADCKHQLADWREKIRQHLLTLRLRLHARKRVVSRTSDGLRLLGWRVWPGRTWVRKDYLRRVRRRFSQQAESFRCGDMQTNELRQRTHAWLGHMRNLSGQDYLADVLSDIVWSRTMIE